MYETFSGLFVNVVVIVKSLVWCGSALRFRESFRKRTRMAGSSLKSICRKFRHVYERIDVDDLRNPECVFDWTVMKVLVDMNWIAR